MAEEGGGGVAGAGFWTIVALYATAALTVGAFVAAVYALPCEGRGFCADLDRQGGYGVVVAGPPLTVVLLAFVARARGTPRWLHIGSVLVIALVPLLVLGAGALADD